MVQERGHETRYYAKDTCILIKLYKCLYVVTYF